MKLGRKELNVNNWCAVQRSEGLRLRSIVLHEVTLNTGSCFLFIVISKSNFQRALGTSMGASALDMHDTRA